MPKISFRGERTWLFVMAVLIVIVAVGTAWLLTHRAGPSPSFDERREALSARFVALEANNGQEAESARFDRFVDLLLEDFRLEHPEYAVYYGFGGEQDRIGVQSRETRRYLEQAERLHLEVLRSIDPLQLSESRFLNYGLLERKLHDAVDGQAFPSYCLSFDQMWGVHQEFQGILSSTPNMHGIAGYRNYIARMGYFDDMVDATIADLSECLQDGITPPKTTLPAAVDQVKELKLLGWDESPSMRPFQEFPENISAASRDRLFNEAYDIYAGEITPALDKLIAFLETEYVPGARDTLGMSELPDGHRWYASRVRGWTTTDLSPHQIHELGLTEVERIRSDMDRIRQAAGYRGSLERFGAYLRTDKRFGFKDRQAILERYRRIGKTVDGRVGRLFGRMPNLTYDIVPVPPYLETSVPDAYYESGSPADGRPGRFFVNTYEPATRTTWSAEDLFLHEAVPGHHFQMTIGQETAIPWFRQMGEYGAFVEGWGLYAETLGEELGLYEDPYAKYGQLVGEQWRAVRLVVDTGIHEYGWDRQQAIDFFRYAVAGAVSDHQIEVEVDRYIVDPGQALSYKIGQLKFRELRTRAEQELGERFDVRAFHDFILEGGALPLNILESRFNKWLSEQ